jgi:hypothetical protein
VVDLPPAGERQVLICPDCYPAARAELVHCSRCDGVRLVKRLDQVECLGCRLTRDALPAAPAEERAPPAPQAASAPAVSPGSPAPRATDPALAAEVAAALDRILRDRPSPPG